MPTISPSCVNIVRSVDAGRWTSPLEVDELGNGFLVLNLDGHVGWLDVPMDDALLMRVLDAFTHLDEELQSLRRGEACSCRSSR